MWHLMIVQIHYSSTFLSIGVQIQCHFLIQSWGFEEKKRLLIGGGDEVLREALFSVYPVKFISPISVSDSVSSPLGTTDLVQSHVLAAPCTMPFLGDVLPELLLEKSSSDYFRLCQETGLLVSLVLLCRKLPIFWEVFP